MDDKEYTYDIDKYTIGVDENGEDGIGMTVAKIENGEIYFLGNCYGENARCIDLLIKENQKLKKQLEEYLIQNINLRADIMIQKMAFPNELIKDKTFYNLYDMPTYEELLAQQKEFINYLENEIYSIEPKGTGIIYNCEYDSEEDYVMAMQEQSRLNTLKEILQECKSIMGDDK